MIGADVVDGLWGDAGGWKLEVEAVSWKRRCMVSERAR